MLSAHWIPSPFGCWPLHLVIQSGVPCALSRSVPALFWLSCDLVLRHLYVSDHLNCTIINPRVSRAPPHLISDTLGDPLGKLIPPFSLTPSLWHSWWSSAQLFCIFWELFIPQINHISHLWHREPLRWHDLQHRQGVTKFRLNRQNSTMKLWWTVSASLIDTDQESSRKYQLSLSFRGQSHKMMRPLTSQCSQSMSRSLTDMSESTHQEVRLRETMSEQNQQNPGGTSMKKMLLKQLSDTGPPLLSRMTMIRPDTRSASRTSYGSHVTRPVHHTSHCLSPPCSLYSRIYPKTSRWWRPHSSIPWLSFSSWVRVGQSLIWTSRWPQPHPHQPLFHFAWR